LPLPVAPFKTTKRRIHASSLQSSQQPLQSPAATRGSPILPPIDSLLSSSTSSVVKPLHKTGLSATPAQKQGSSTRSFAPSAPRSTTVTAQHELPSSLAHSQPKFFGELPLLTRPNKKRKIDTFTTASRNTPRQKSALNAPQSCPSVQEKSRRFIPLIIKPLPVVQHPESPVDQDATETAYLTPCVGHSIESTPIPVRLSLKQRKGVDKWVIILGMMPPTELATCALVSKTLRYAGTRYDMNYELDSCKRQHTWQHTESFAKTSLVKD
jgi:hypothetical protein